MPIRNTTIVQKNSDIVNRPLPSTLLKGESIVNTAEGIVYFSGVTTSTSNWTPAGTGTTANFFEAGSNLYNLALRNKITKYEGVTDMSGKFLSGTSQGLVLANISALSSASIYTTGSTYNAATGTITFSRNDSNSYTTTGFNYVTAATLNSGNIFTVTSNGGSPTNTTINAVTGGSFSNGVITFSGSGVLSSITGIGSSTADTYVTAFTYSNNTFSIIQTLGSAPITATINSVTGLTVAGLLTATAATMGSLSATTFAATNVFATGGTITTFSSTNLGATGATINTISATTLTATTQYGTDSYMNGQLKSYSGVTNLTGRFLSGTSTGFVLAPISGITGVDTYTTGFTYNPSQNQITLSQTQGQSPLNVFITAVSGLTVSNLTANRMVYTTTGGLLVGGTASFDGTNMVLPSNGALTVGSGGLTVGSGGTISSPGSGDVVIHGNLTVFGNAYSAFTSQLYVEDPNITLNYNPTGSTIATSIGAGLSIQDGNGISGTSVSFDIRAMNTFTGITASQVPSITEYTAATGYSNRAFVTQLNDIVVRSSNPVTPNGVRLLAEFDILDGGSY